LSLLYKVINKRCPHRSTALITNIDFDAWNEYLDDDPIVMALLDRLFYHAIIMRFKDAKSYRAHRTKAVASTRGSKARKKPAERNK
jgi:DNA replication protein DnaC